MIHPEALREFMPMPDPYFPVKLHPFRKVEHGETLFPHHWHEHLEFLYCTAGRAMIECNSVPLILEAGDLIVVNSNELHYGISESDDLLYYAMIVDISLLHSYAPDAVETKFITPLSQNHILFQNHIFKDQEIIDCIVSLIYEMECKEAGYELSIKSYLYRILAILFRRYVAPNESLDIYKVRLYNLERFTPILSYIDENFHERLSVDLLAKRVGLSRFYFSRIFKQLTNRTVTEYINMIRIHKSELLLRNTNMSISEIALATGFSDIAYFSNVYKKMKKESPSYIRKN